MERASDERGRKMPRKKGKRGSGEEEKIKPEQPRDTEQRDADEKLGRKEERE